MSRILVIVEASPWGSSLSTAAWRFVRAAVTAGVRVTVFFTGDGVYNAVAGELSDQGLDSPQQCWQAFGASQDVELWLCPAAVARRLPAQVADQLFPDFTVTGLTRLFEQMAASDRVVSF